MKRSLALILILILLVSCSPAQTSDTLMATRVAGILTSQPGETTETVEPAAAETNPTAAPISPTALPSPTFTVAPSATPTPAEVTEPEPTVPAASATPETVIAAAATSTPPPTLTPAVSPTAFNPSIPSSPPSSVDAMDNATAWGWPTGTDFAGFTTLSYNNGEMRLTGLQPDKGGWRLAMVKPLTNFYLEMTARLDKCKPADKYGLIFRVPVLNEADRGYLFGISCAGEYYLRKWDGKVRPNGQSTTLIAAKTNPAINTGDAANRLGVLAVGGDISLYVNDVLVGQYHDTTFPSGYFGVFVTPVQTANLTVRVDQMRYWENPK